MFLQMLNKFFAARNNLLSFPSTSMLWISEVKGNN